MKPLYSLLVLYSGFAINLSLNRYLSTCFSLDGIGDYNVAVSVSSVLAVIVLLGGQSSANYFIPRYISEERWQRVKGYMVFYVKVAITAGFSVAIAGVFGSYALAHLMEGKFLHEAYFALVLTPIVAICDLFKVFIQSMGRPVSASAIDRIARPTVFFGLLLVWIQLGGEMNEYKAFLLLFSGNILTIFIQLRLLRKVVSFNFWSTKSSYDYGEWKSVSKPMLAITLANTVMSKYDLIVLEIFHSTETEVGAFSLLMFVSSVVWLNYESIVSISIQKISYFHDNRAALLETYSRNVVQLLVVNFATVVPMVVFAKDILFWLHPDLVSYDNWLVFLLIGSSVNSVIQLASPVLKYGGFNKESAYIANRILLISMLAIPPLIYFFGLPGALVFLVSIRFCRGVWFVVYLKKYMGLVFSFKK